ncbi:hypothetical protein FP435_03485 [Lactobacillus sp. PV037]|uniref:hypothetical protein n=1 Tax=Lactobacillus sp. PV037 TaxID=2594496 RepID=UPI0022407CCE|nr:hypothetical protein [Lactobacillus sp. PV037]QNQ83570.1 hypothetical protein FP435_03485 [Lactobacillus sp. PV037]
MTKFSALFRELLSIRWRSVKTLILLQVVATVLLSIFGYLKTEAFHNLTVLVQIFSILAPIVDMLYLVISAWKNEQVYGSTTWRLVPVSSTKLYLGNLLSDIIGGIYLGLLQIVGVILTSLPLLFNKDVRRGLGILFSNKKDGLFNPVTLREIGNGLKDGGLEFISLVLSFLIALLLIILIFYTGVTLLNLSSRVIVDFLPEKFNRLYRFIVLTVLFIVLLISSLNFIEKLYNNLSIALSLMSGSLESFGVFNVSVGIFVVIFSLINIWLLKNYYEGK